MRQISIYLCFLAFLQGCATYKNRFDCPTPTGVGCHSVSEIESMIIEREGEEDVFYPDESKQVFSNKDERSCCRKASNVLSKDPSINSGKVKRIWVAPRKKKSGISVGAHYVHFTVDPQDSWLLLTQGEDHE
ncbi:MAG: hypothetical protein CMO81_00070 [Waddliaceae bacterium]|nr:hypothetical protein [Waddliaceae bacterium]|tara:strand:+ start:163 stop:558 length:396 start_codon:yes stop_codon:yes gene_type:complete